MNKRVMSLLLAVILLLSILPFRGYTEGTETLSTEAATEATENTGASEPTEVTSPSETTETAAPSETTEAAEESTESTGQTDVATEPEETVAETTESTEPDEPTETTESTEPEEEETPIRITELISGYSPKYQSYRTDIIREHTVSSVADLQELYDYVAAGGDTSGHLYTLTADITLPASWKPIGVLKAGASGAGNGTNILPFCGVINGNGHTLTVAEGGLPLLGHVRDAMVCNLNVYGKQIAGYGIVNNYVVDYGDSGSYSGKAANTITFFRVTLKSGSSTLQAGFIGGYASGTNEIYFMECTVEKGVTIGYSKDKSSIGSFGGQASCYMLDCVSYADVYGKKNVGGMIGLKGQAMGPCYVENSQFHGTVTATGEYAGGIVGSGYNVSSAPNTPGVSMISCQCDGTVTGTDYVGGLLGGEPVMEQCWDNGISYIRGNRFTGTINAAGAEYVGGVIGYLKSLNRYNIIENNYYSSTCGAEKGIGHVLYVDTSMYSDGTDTPKGWVDGTYYMNTAEDSIDKIKADTNPTGSYKNISKTNHNRTDDPLGADADALTKTDSGTTAEPTATKLTVSGSYKTEYTVGESLDISGMKLTVTYDDGSQKEVSASGAEISGFDSSTPGEKTLVIRHSNVSTTIKITVKKASSEIKVTITILGDSAHGDNGSVHTYAGGGLKTWVKATTYTMDSNDTVWDLLQKVFQEKGLTCKYTSASGTVYVQSVTCNGVTVAEFTNGSLSGWMYTLNGSYPLLGVAQQYLSDGDKIVFHYTDDYTVERHGFQSGEEESTVEAVETLIDKIGSSITLSSESAIQAARTAYNALTDQQKSQVENYSKLTAAEYQLALLKASDADKEKAQEVIDLIGALGEITHASAEAIAEARSAYDALTDLQKALVTNYDVLETAENTLKTLNQIHWRDAYQQTGDYMQTLGTPNVGSIGGEWMVIGLARSGRTVPDGYYENAVTYVTENVDENGRLHRAKSTDNSRMILALTAIGKDVTNVGGYNLLQGLSDMDYVQYQGINGPIWALIALDSGNYPVPEGNVTREGLIQAILDAQRDDGGWALSGTAADADMTGMALQALAPYYGGSDQVTQAVDEALDRLFAMQREDGSYASVDGPSSESIAQVIVALTALGIDPDADVRFIKNGTSVLDALMAYYVDGGGFRHIPDGGGFRHIPDGERDGMATEQAYYALAAYARFLEGKTALYDMTDILDLGGRSEQEMPAEQMDADDDSASEKGVQLLLTGSIVLIVLLCGGILAVWIILKKRTKKTN